MVIPKYGSLVLVVSRPSPAIQAFSSLRLARKFTFIETAQINLLCQLAIRLRQFPLCLGKATNNFVTIILHRLTRGAVGPAHGTCRSFLLSSSSSAAHSRTSRSCLSGGPKPWTISCINRNWCHLRTWQAMTIAILCEDVAENGTALITAVGFANVTYSESAARIRLDCRGRFYLTHRRTHRAEGPLSVAARHMAMPSSQSINDSAPSRALSASSFGSIPSHSAINETSVHCPQRTVTLNMESRYLLAYLASNVHSLCQVRLGVDLCDIG